MPKFNQKTHWAFTGQWLEQNLCAASVRLCNPFLMSASISLTYFIQGTYCTICFIGHLISSWRLKWSYAWSRTDYREGWHFQKRYHFIWQVKTTFWQVEFLVATGNWSAELILDREHNRWSAPRLAKNIENLSMWFSLAWWQMLFCPGTHCWPVSYLFLRNTPVVPSICFMVT